jgi:CheY-like chemotaxis protein
MAETVLVVDDEPLVLEVTASMLEALGWAVITAKSGKEALTRLEADDRIALLPIDVNMPGINGYELAKRAKRSRPDLRVIILSGRETDGRGFPLLRKPFSLDDLRQRVEGLGDSG